MTVTVHKVRYHETVRYTHHEAGREYVDSEPTWVRRSFYKILVDGRRVDTALTRKKAELRAARLRIKQKVIKDG